MDFSKAYNREAFIAFLRDKFLPEDFVIETSKVDLTTQTSYTQSVVRLGRSKSLDLVVYEVRHTSRHDARVGLSREAFRLLADEYEDKAIVAFVPQDSDVNYRLSLIEITLGIDEAKVTRTYSNPRRSSYLLGEGIATYTPNKYLNEKGRIASDDDLRSRFPVEVLTKEFYRELSAWYAWAVRDVRFPNDITTTEDDQKLNNEGVIRLITRLIFVWFLKQRGLIPWQFFDEDYIRENLLENFNPNVKVDLFTKSKDSRYYKAILQNLFFAMLNCPITREGSTELTERRFMNGRSGHDDNKLMRYKWLFKDPALFLKLANETVPFLNGGLFDCLDEKDKGMYYDGFSERKDSMEQLCVPDYLFFGENVGKDLDLSGWYGDTKMKKVDVRGIIPILKTYNFTVEENMPFDKDVSLDPELLGKAFENLLAEYNPETRSTARKQTGSFYTPREIVQYMVDESLVAHLKRTVGEELEGEYRKLLSYTDDEVNLTDEQRTQIMQSLYRCKILDPACGSGAFPVGILQQMVHILTQIDPDNSRWKDMLMDQAISETSEAYRTASPEERAEMVGDIERSFDENVNRPDYARKLYLIENCIFGVDIQAIAIQISKLRFFISLVVDQKINNNPADNFGIRPLPNLEAKFVAANTLIGLKRAEADLFDSEEIKRKEKEMKAAKHRIFSARTYRTKKKYREQVATLRQEIADLLVANNMIGNEQAQQLAQWDMFDQNASSPFFDPEWMFGVKDGFDIVIGNPPYGIINKKQNKGESISVPKEIELYYKTEDEYKPAQGGGLNIYRLFIVKSINLLCNNGCFSEIFQLAFAGDVSAAKTRKYVFDNTSIICLEAFPERDNPQKRVFENAKMSVCILNLQRRKDQSSAFFLRINRDKYVDVSVVPSSITVDEILAMDSKYYTIPIAEKHDIELLTRIFSNSKNFSYYGKCNTGEIDMTFCKNAFTRNQEDVKMLRGANIGRYFITDKMSQGETFYLNMDVLRNTKRITQSLFCDERIIMQGITGINESTRLKMVISKDAFCANSVNYCSFKSNEDIYFFLAILNSKLLNYVFKQFSTNSNVNGYEVDNLPIKRDIKTEPLLSILAKGICVSKKHNPNADTSAEEQEIDRLVYKLYGLTYEEVLTVDPETPLTEEVYNKID